MTSAALDTRFHPISGPKPTRTREVLITWAAEIAAKSRAEIFSHWLSIAATRDTAQRDVDVALQHARECAEEFVDFAALAGRDPERFVSACAVEFGRNIEVARAVVRAEVVARSGAKAPA